MNEIKLEMILDALEYTPVNLDQLQNCDHDFVWIDFEKKNGLSPSIEFCKWSNSLYFEVIDFNGYEEGTIIQNDRRLHVLDFRNIDVVDFDKMMAMVNSALRKVYEEVK